MVTDTCEQSRRDPEWQGIQQALNSYRFQPSQRITHSFCTKQAITYVHICNWMLYLIQALPLHSVGVLGPVEAVQAVPIHNRRWHPECECNGVLLAPLLSELSAESATTRAQLSHDHTVGV